MIMIIAAMILPVILFFLLFESCASLHDCRRSARKTPCPPLSSEPAAAGSLSFLCHDHDRHDHDDHHGDSRPAVGRDCTVLYNGKKYSLTPTTQYLSIEVRKTRRRDDR
jgi:hypothetical protein